MSKKKNILKQAYELNSVAFKPLKSLPLYKVDSDNVVWIGVDKKKGKIFYEKMLKEPESSRGSGQQVANQHKKIMNLADDLDIMPVKIIKYDLSRSSEFNEVKEYLEYKDLSHLAKKFKKFKREDLEEKFKKDYRMSEGKTYYLYMSGRGSKSEPKSYVPFTFNELKFKEVGGDVVPEYHLSGKSTIVNVPYDKLNDWFKDEKILTENDYMEFAMDKGYANAKEIHTKDDLRKLSEFVDEYKKNKSKENREALAKYLEKFISLAGDLANDGDYSLLYEVFKTNMVLPYTSRVEMYPLFIADAIGVFSSYSKYIEPSNLKKPVWDFISKKGIRKVYERKTPIKLTPFDKGLENIASMFVGQDELRPVFQAIHFDEHGATMTDAHQLFHINDKVDKKLHGKNLKPQFIAKKEYKNLENTKEFSFTEFYEHNKFMDVKYPNYLSVVPNHTNYVNVNIALLASICETLFENKLLNPQALQIKLGLHAGEGKYDSLTLSERGFQYLGINAKFIVSVAKAMMMLGHTKVNIFFGGKTKGILIVPEKITDLYGVENETFALLMPTMLDAESGNDNFVPSTVEISSESIDVRVGTTERKTLTPQTFYHSGSKKDVPAKKEVSKTKKTSDKGLSKGDWVENKKAQFKGQIYEIEPSLNRMKLKDEWGNENNKWFPIKGSKKIEPPKKQSKQSEADFLKDKIEAFKMMLEMEDDKKEKDFLKDKIEAFEMMLEMES